MSVAIEVSRADEIGRLKGFKDLRGRKERRVGACARGSARLRFWRIRIDRVNVAAQQTDYAGTYARIADDQIGHTVFVKICRGHRQRLRLVLPQDLNEFCGTFVISQHFAPVGEIDSRITPALSADGGG